MVSRKSHPKSRNGCAQCKRRRIKCDEIRPQCSNCMKHEIDCDFSTNPPKLEDSPKASDSKRQRTRSSDTKSVRHSSVGLSPASPGTDVNGPDRNLKPLQMEELELLHHFITETCYTLSDRLKSHELWRITIPQIAFQHEFLMRGILAISALHLSNLRPMMKEHYTRAGVEQQDAALSSFRPIMSGMDDTNCDASFAMSSLIVVYGFESPKASDSLGMFSYQGERSDEWLPLIRGVNSILQSLWTHVKSGRLSGLLHDHEGQPAPTDLPNVLSDQLSNLEQFCDNIQGDEEDITACKMALGQLRHCFVKLNNKTPDECEVSLAFLWPVMIPERFLTMLHKKRPEALIILAHYCVILHHLDGYWWMRGWAGHIMDNIQRELRNEWQYWLEWPSHAVSVEAKVLTNGYLQNPSQGMRVSSDFNTGIGSQLVIPKEELSEIR